MIGCLKNQRDDVQGDAVDALGKLGKAAVEPLITS